MKTTTIFMKEFDGRRKYSKAVKYQKDGVDKFAYYPVQFRKGVELANKTKIIIKDRWEGAYEGKNGVVFYEFVNDFEQYSSFLTASNDSPHIGHVLVLYLFSTLFFRYFSRFFLCCIARHSLEQYLAFFILGYGVNSFPHISHFNVSVISLPPFRSMLPLPLLHSTYRLILRKRIRGFSLCLLFRTCLLVLVLCCSLLPLQNCIGVIFLVCE